LGQGVSLEGLDRNEREKRSLTVFLFVPIQEEKNETFSAREREKEGKRGRGGKPCQEIASSLGQKRKVA